MTERKFTPPTEFPAEYVTTSRRKVVILGRAPVGDYPLIGYVLHAEVGSDRPDFSSTKDWTEGGQHYIGSSGPYDLHDIPKRITTWHNVYGTYTHSSYVSRSLADQASIAKRLCVYRIERDEDGRNPEIFVEEV